MYRLLIVCGFSILIIFLALATSGCGGGGGLLPSGEQAGPGDVAQPAEPVTMDAPAGLPSLASLPGLPEVTRSSSYVEADLITFGDDFESSLPHPNTSVNGCCAVFASNWDPGQGTAAGLSYCMYVFTAPGYDRTPELNYRWADPPVDLGNAYIGLGNWDTLAWDWFAFEADGSTAVVSFDSYLNGSDQMVVVVVQTGIDNSKLLSLRLGPHPITAVATADPAAGFAPLNVSYDTTGSDFPFTIERHEWDLDGNGTYEGDSAGYGGTYKSYQDAGEYTVGLRVTDEYGFQATTSETVTVMESWTHSWGTTLSQVIEALDTDNQEYIYAAGSTSASTVDRDALLQKYNAAGVLQWAMSWGGDAAECINDVDRTDDGIFTTGYSESYGAGGYDMLIQRWDEDGNVVWTRVWGGTGLEQGNGLAVTGDAVYVVGEVGNPTTRDIVVMKLDLDGVPVWGKRWDGGNFSWDQARDIRVSRKVFAPDVDLHITGNKISPDPFANNDLLYLNFKADGTLANGKVWRSDDGSDQAGMAVEAYNIGLTREIWLGGYYVDADAKRMGVAMRVHSSSVYSWSIGSESVVVDLERMGDSVVIAGQASGIDGTNGGTVARISTSGDLESALFWADNDSNTQFKTLYPHPKGGWVAAGTCKAADDGHWGSLAGTVSSVDGLWLNVSGTISTVDTTMVAPYQQGIEMVGGIMDAGGGSRDALLCTVPYI